MSRFVQWLNFMGVLLLAVLCSVQWSASQRQGDFIADMQQSSRDQSVKLSAQKQQLEESADGQVLVRERLDISEKARHDDETKLATLRAEDISAAAETAQLKRSLCAWITACNARDSAIKQANTAIAALSARYLETVAKYNDLVGEYNRLRSPSILSTQPARMAN